VIFIESWMIHLTFVDFLVCPAKSLGSMGGATSISTRYHNSTSSKKLYSFTSMIRSRVFFKDSNIIPMYSILGDYFVLKNHTYRNVGEHSIRNI
jgi:hypothetical protein